MLVFYLFLVFFFLLYSLKITFRGWKIVRNSIKIVGLQCKGRSTEFSGFSWEKWKEPNSTRQFFLPSKTLFLEFFCPYVFFVTFYFLKIKIIYFILLYFLTRNLFYFKADKEINWNDIYYCFLIVNNNLSSD